MITAATSKYVSASSPPTRTTADHDQAASVPIEISVSIVAARWRALCSAARWKPAAAPEDDGGGEHERDPLPAGELQRGHHGDERERHSERDGHGEAPAKNGDRLVVVLVSARIQGGARVIPGRLDRRHEIVDRDGRVAVHGRLLGREVDGASTPSSLLSLRSMRATHDAHVMPSRSRSDLRPGCLGSSSRRLVPRFLDRRAQRRVVERSRRSP